MLKLLGSVSLLLPVSRARIVHLPHVELRTGRKDSFPFESKMSKFMPHRGFARNGNSGGYTRLNYRYLKVFGLSSGVQTNRSAGTVKKRMMRFDGRLRFT